MHNCIFITLIVLQPAAVLGNNFTRMNEKLKKNLLLRELLDKVGWHKYGWERIDKPERNKITTTIKTFSRNTRIRWLNNCLKGANGGFALNADIKGWDLIEGFYDDKLYLDFKLNEITYNVGSYLLGENGSIELIFYKDQCKLNNPKGKFTLKCEDMETCIGILNYFSVSKYEYDVTICGSDGIACCYTRSDRPFTRQEIQEWEQSIEDGIFVNVSYSQKGFVDHYHKWLNSKDHSGKANVEFIGMVENPTFTVDWGSNLNTTDAPSLYIIQHDGTRRKVTHAFYNGQDGSASMTVTVRPIGSKWGSPIEQPRQECLRVIVGNGTVFTEALRKFDLWFERY